MNEVPSMHPPPGPPPFLRRAWWRQPGGRLLAAALAMLVANLVILALVSRLDVPRDLDLSYFRQIAGPRLGVR